MKIRVQKPGAHCTQMVKRVTLKDYWDHS